MTDIIKARAAQPNPLDFVAATGCGFVAALLVAYIHLMIYKHAQLSLYTWMTLNGLLPTGAIICGIFVGTGYFIGASLTNYLPNFRLMICMILIAVMTQGLMYFAEYLDSRPDDYTLSLNGFIEYVDSTLTESVYVRSTGEDETFTDPVGSWGYGLAALQLAGFMVGSLICYSVLRARPACKPCRKYMKWIGSIHHYFQTRTEFQQYYRRLEDIPSFSEGWAKIVAEEGHGKMIVDRGAIACNFILRECPGCHRQDFSRDVDMARADDWVSLGEYDIETAVPEGISLAPYFEKKKKRAI